MLVDQVRQVRVKRRRSEDPLPALVVRGTKRKRLGNDGEDQGLVFTLAPNDYMVDNDGLAAMDLEEGPGHVFKVPRTHQPSNVGEDIPSELHDMLKDYIHGTKASAGAAKDTTSGPSGDVDPETEDYVYDIYYSNRRSTPSQQAIGGTVGYIELESDQEHLFFADDDDSDASEPILEGDEDSNAEDFYRNEYPEGSSSDIDSDLAGLEDELGDLHVEDRWSEDSEGS